MRQTTKMFLGMSMSLWVLPGLVGCDRPEPAAPRSGPTPSASSDIPLLPASLDRLYPPRAPAPLFFMAMTAMGNAAQGLLVDLQQGDTAGILANWKAFRAAYIKVRSMVPQWRPWFPDAPLRRLEAALKTGDTKLVMPQFMELTKRCSTCHERYMVAVQARHHWPSFAGIKVTDPLTKRALTFNRFMMGMSLSLSGILNDLKQGQRDRALEHVAAFRARFATLKLTCDKCHDSPRTYYVDPSIDAHITKIEAQVRATPPDFKALGRDLKAVGKRSCDQCHHVHVPAAMLQRKLRRRVSQ